MSKLIEIIRRAVQSEGPHIGFGAPPARKRRPLVLLAELATADLKLATQVVDRGVEALFFPVRASVEETEIIRQIARAAGDVPWGVRLAAPTLEELPPLVDMGCDFVVATASAPISFLRGDTPGRLLEIDANLPDSLLRAVDLMPVEAALIASGGEGVPTIADLLGYWRTAAMWRKPAILAARDGLEGADLALLRDAGVGAVVVSVADESAIERLAAFKQAIENLPPPRPVRHRSEGILPTGGALAGS